MYAPLSRIDVPLVASLLSWQASAADLAAPPPAELIVAFEDSAPLFDAQHRGTKALSFLVKPGHGFGTS